MMMDDAQLLRRYVEARSQPDFTALVERHLNIVYQAALRQLHGRTDLAKDTAQQVFTTLAREASHLVNHPTLVGWLFTATRHAASHIRRSEERRLAREREAHMRNSLENSVPDASWEQVRDQLDEVMETLSERDRTAVLLRFFHNQGFEEIGSTLGLNKDTARKRIERALERVRSLLAKRGITSTAAALGAMLSAQSSFAAPAGLARSIACTALLPGAAAGLPTPGLLYFMNLKLALGVAGTLGLAALLVLPPAGLALYEAHQASVAETDLSAARTDGTYRDDVLAGLKADLRAAEGRTASLREVRERAPAGQTADPNTRVSGSAGQRGLPLAQAEALTHGQEFLTRFAEARPLVLDLGRAQLHSGYAAFYRNASLTPAQIEEFERQTAEHWLKSLAVSPTGVRPMNPQLSDAQLQEIFGADNFQVYQEFVRNRNAYVITGQVELAVGFAAPALSREQSELLVQAVLISSDAPQTTERLRMENVNWPAALAMVEKILTPEQWTAAQPALLNGQLQTTLDKARREAAVHTQ